MVAKVLYSVTMSLDGYIAGPGGDMQWLVPYLEAPNPEAEALVERVGALLVGRRTYDGDDPNRGTPQEGAFGGRWHGAQFVLTRTPPTDAPDGVVFLDEVSDAVARAKEVAGDRYVNVLGASAARSCVEIGELDEVLAFVAPVLLGGGTRLFEQPGRAPVRLEPMEVTTAPMATGLWFRVAD